MLTTTSDLVLPTSHLRRRIRKAKPFAQVHGDWESKKLDRLTFNQCVADRNGRGRDMPISFKREITLRHTHPPCHAPATNT